MDPVLDVDPVLDAAIARDQSHGARIAALTWFVALLHGTLGFVAIQGAVRLVGVDRSLVSTPEIETIGASFLAVRVALGVKIVIGGILAVRWLAAAVPTARALARLGGIAAGGGPGGEPRGEPSGEADRPRRWIDDAGLLLRPAGVASGQESWSDIRVGDGRPLVRRTLIVLALAAGVGAAAAMMAAVAADVDTARLAGWIAGLDAGLWILGTLLIGAVAADIGWRRTCIFMHRRTGGQRPILPRVVHRIQLRQQPARYGCHRASAVCNWIGGAAGR